LQLATLMPSARAAAGLSKGGAGVTVDPGGSALHAAPAERRIWHAISDSPGQHFVVVLGVLTVGACGATGRASLARAAERAGGALVVVLSGVPAASGVAGGGGGSLAAVATGLLGAVPATLGTSAGALAAAAAVAGAPADALDLERTPANATAPTIATTASAIAPIRIGPLLPRTPPSFSAGTYAAPPSDHVTGGASGAVNREANAPPPLRFAMSSARGAGASPFEVAEISARMSMSADDSVTSGAGGAGACFASAASEKSTLLSLRSPVSGVA
jgi:hypothetical protein